MLLVVFHVHCGHKQWSIGEQIVHLFERTFLRLWLEGPEEESVSEVADHLVKLLVISCRAKIQGCGATYEEDVVPPAYTLHGYRGDLANQSVERKRDHDADGDTFGTCASVENLGRHNP